MQDAVKLSTAMGFGLQRREWRSNFHFYQSIVAIFEGKIDSLICKYERSWLKMNPTVNKKRNLQAHAPHLKVFCAIKKTSFEIDFSLYFASTKIR